MGGDTETRLSILTKLSNLSVKYDKRKKKKSAGKAWLEVQRELGSICGKMEKEEEMDLLMRIADSEEAAKKSGLAEIPPSSEMTVLRRKKHP